MLLCFVKSLFVCDKNIQKKNNTSGFVGVSSVEVMIGHTVTQCVVMAGQVTLLLVFALAVFHVSLIFTGKYAVSCNVE